MIQMKVILYIVYLNGVPFMWGKAYPLFCTMSNLLEIT
jgi:hypothetical protein